MPNGREMMDRYLEIQEIKYSLKGKRPTLRQELATRLIEGLLRVVVVDNVRSMLSDANIEAWVTAKRLSGKRMYEG